MIQVEEITHAASQIQAWRDSGQTIGLVPTMGFFHDGHLSLMRKSRELADRTVATIFINPRQFGPNEDLKKYPRNPVGDAQLAENTGVDMLFCPPAELIYPANYQTNISVSHLSKGLCGTSRPGHFDGVATIVTKLFNIITPNFAVFGKKDFQQLALIRQLATDLNFNIEIIGHEIVREKDGLAMSSRNKYLDPTERQEALCLYQALQKAVTIVSKEIKVDATALKRELSTLLNKTKSCSIDYIEIVDSHTLHNKKIAQAGDLLALAAYFNNKVRLIDNTEL